jgi:methionyl-tRNA formyltransferase
MRILACLNRDLASNFALNLLLPTLAEHTVLVGLSERVGSPGGTQEPRERAELRAAEQVLPNELLYPLIEGAGLPDDGLRRLTFAEIERHRGIRVASLPDPNSAAGLEAVTAFAPDLLLTIRYGAILKRPVISIPRLGVLNLHSGILPAYRGVLATFRALMNDAAHVGCTLHYIQDPTIDTGDVVGIRTIAVRRDRSLLWHILALYPPGISLLSETITGLASGRAPPRAAQATTGGAYYSFPSAQEWAEFTGRGWRVADASDLLGVVATAEGRSQFESRPGGSQAL